MLRVPMYANIDSYILYQYCVVRESIREINHRSIDNIQQENIIIFSYKIGELSCA